MIKPADGDKGQGYSAAHQAIDWGSKDYFNTPIIAPFSGTVSATGQMGSGNNDAGLAVDITSGRYKVRLCHLNSISAKVGQIVSEGQEVGKMGYTGYTIPSGIGGTHTHVVLWDNGVRKNIENYITRPYEVMEDNMSVSERETLQSAIYYWENRANIFESALYAALNRGETYESAMNAARSELIKLQSKKEPDEKVKTIISDIESTLEKYK